MLRKKVKTSLHQSTNLKVSGSVASFAGSSQSSNQSHTSNSQIFSQDNWTWATATPSIDDGLADTVSSSIVSQSESSGVLPSQSDPFVVSIGDNYENVASPKSVDLLAPMNVVDNNDLDVLLLPISLTSQGCYETGDQQNKKLSCDVFVDNGDANDRDVTKETVVCEKCSVTSTIDYVLTELKDSFVQSDYQVEDVTDKLAVSEEMDGNFFQMPQNSGIVSDVVVDHQQFEPVSSRSNSKDFIVNVDGADDINVNIESETMSDLKSKKQRKRVDNKKTSVNVDSHYISEKLLLNPNTHASKTDLSSSVAAKRKNSSAALVISSASNSPNLIGSGKVLNAIKRKVGRPHKKHVDKTANVSAAARIQRNSGSIGKRKPGRPRKDESPCSEMSHPKGRYWLPLVKGEEILSMDIPGGWVECTDCYKWRYLTDMIEGCRIPDRWVCSLMGAGRSCSEPDDDVNNIAIMSNQCFVETDYVKGSIVWARLDGHPWWPAIVDNDPDYHCFLEFAASRNKAVTFHLVFFGDPVSRCWLNYRDIKPFVSCDRDFRWATVEGRRLVEVCAAAQLAESAMELSMVERIEKYGLWVRFLKMRAKKDKKNKKNDKEQREI